MHEPIVTHDVANFDFKQMEPISREHSLPVKFAFYAYRTVELLRPLYTPLAFNAVVRVFMPFSRSIFVGTNDGANQNGSLLFQLLALRIDRPEGTEPCR